MNELEVKHRARKLAEILFGAGNFIEYDWQGQFEKFYKSQSPEASSRDRSLTAFRDCLVEYQSELASLFILLLKQEGFFDESFWESERWKYR